MRVRILKKEELIKELRKEFSRDSLRKEISNYTITKYDRKVITELGENIIRLRKDGMSVRDIQKKLGCSKSTVSSYCYLVENNDKIRKDCLMKANELKQGNAALGKELEWLRKAKSKSRYRGTFNYQSRHVDYRDNIIAKYKHCMRCKRPVSSFIPHFHHVDPTTKLFEINCKTRRPPEEWVEEVNKCSMLCSICHAFAHKHNVSNLEKCNIALNDISNPTIDINSITIKSIPKEDLELLCHKCHYLGASKKGGKSYGFMFNDELIAAALITNPTRKQSKINNEPTLELSRFIIIGKMRMKNVASKCLSILIKYLKRNTEYKWLISFTEKDLHIGTIYKAANFKEVGPSNTSSYNYEGIHKKTIYERAKRFDMSEYEYARFFNLQRIKENPKIKFIYRLTVEDK